MEDLSENEQDYDSDENIPPQLRTCVEKTESLCCRIQEIETTPTVLYVFIRILDILYP